MNKLMVCLFAALAGASTALPALAQDATTTLPTRVVIAPPQSELARTIKTGLATAYYGAAKGSTAYNEAQKLYFFYGERHFEPLWLEQAANGDVAFSASAQKILKLFLAAGSEGLRPSDYLTPDLDVAGAKGDPLKMAALETAFSGAAMRYASNIYTGRIRPLSLSENLDIQPKVLDQSALMMQLASSADPVAVLQALEPTHPEFLALKAALANFDAGSVDQPVHIADGKTLKPGMSDDRVPQLRERLEVPAVADTTYDDALIDAIKAFQGSLGLTTDGIMGPATVAALNGGTAITRNDILANMERWRWMPRDLGAFNVFVNLPEYRLAIYRQGQEVYTTRVVIGATAHQTPIFSNAIQHIVVNPYWNVPASIVRNEIAPKTRANPGYIAGQNMELLYGGKVVSASSIDWSAVGNSFPFSVRQRPGAGNALGQIKFLFPNKHDVYLHDTPSKSLFARDYRAYSHGCVRVQNPMEFADALLANETTISRASLEAMFGTSERWVNPEHQIPVHLAYFTLRVQPDGTIRSFGDVYGHNAKLIEAMGLNAPGAAPAAAPASVEDGALSP
ncbi:MAG: L,D-transpeptidase family protein [Devosia sp.]|uniref:L,D-transpeptidase family protein n=1 Tax=Devosia sp. TaxID=1871048 RepID=UPI0026182495|nr:L,D-transpeptidase family protein [Devosia sp.]MDB5585324.1 L,D-transpeptidase family protein [Devosia sp.]